MGVKDGSKRPGKMYPECASLIPKELRDCEGAWGFWKWVQSKSNRWTKVPCTGNGRTIGIHDVLHWKDFDESMIDTVKNGVVDGLGFLLRVDTETGDPYFLCIDLDNCRDPETGVIEDWAEEIIDKVNSYTEISPSGEGVKIWMSGHPEGEWSTKSRKDKRIELFYDSRYLCFTGNEIDPLIGFGVRDCTDNTFVRTFLMEHFDMDRGEEHNYEPVELTDDLYIKVQGALEHLTDDEVVGDYSTWLSIGMALKNLEDSERTFELWDEWSSNALNYGGTDELQTKWRSFRPGHANPVGIGTIFFMAQQWGWEMPKEHHPLDDTGMALRVRDRLQGRCRWVDEWNSFYGWEGRYYTPRGEKMIDEALCDVADKMLANPPEDLDEKELGKYITKVKHYRSFAGLKAVLGKLKGHTGCSADVFDNYPNVLPVENGMLLFEGQDVRHIASDPRYLVTKCAPVVYSRSSECPRWEKFIDEITGGDKDLGKYLQKLVGICLTGYTPEEAIYILHGDGCNGKSLFIDVLMNLLGDFAGLVNQAAIVDDRKSSAHETELFVCYNSRLVVTEETDEGVRLRENQVKAVCSNGRMKARQMYQKATTFDRSHKLFMTTNHLPYISGTDDGVWRRIRIIPFKVSFLDKMDSGLAVKLKSELSGILNWAIEGWRLFKVEGIEPPAAVTSEGQEYKSEFDVVQDFIDETVTPAEGHHIEVAVVYAAYRRYCQDRSHYPKSIRLFNKEFRKKLGIDAATNQRPSSCQTKVARCWTGYKIASDFDG